MALGGSFSISGLVSGFDTDGIVDKLMALQKGRVRSLQTQKAQTSQQQNALQGLRTKLNALKDRASALGTDTTFTVSRATSSNETLLKATSDGSATPGTYQVTVKQLAQANQIITDGYASGSGAVFEEGQTVTLNLGGTTYAAITIDANSSSLEGLASAINDAGMDIRASVINDGTADTPYRLVLTSTKTGASNDIGFTYSGATSPTWTTLQVAQDAQVEFGSATPPLVVSGSTNKMSSLISGVTLDLAKADASTPITVTVESDTAAVRGSIDAFISAYNEAADYLKAATKYDSDSKVAGPLQANNTVSAIQFDLPSLVNGELSGSAFGSLAEIGITLDKYGHLTVSDSSSLSSALSDSLDDVKAMFSDSTNGLGNLVEEYLDELTTAADGTLTLQDKYLTDLQTQLDESIEDQTDFLSREEARLREQFSAMETALATFKNQSEFLANSLGTTKKSS